MILSLVMVHGNPRIFFAEACGQPRDSSGSVRPKIMGNDLFDFIASFYFQEYGQEIHQRHERKTFLTPRGRFVLPF